MDPATSNSMIANLAVIPLSTALMNRMKTRLILNLRAIMTISATVLVMKRLLMQSAKLSCTSIAFTTPLSTMQLQMKSR